jgi:hypothetical protein
MPKMQRQMKNNRNTRNNCRAQALFVNGDNHHQNTARIDEATNAFYVAKATQAPNAALIDFTKSST